MLKRLLHRVKRHPYVLAVHRDGTMYRVCGKCDWIEEV